MYEECKKANKEYSASFDRSKLAMPPAKKLAVVVCMDARLMPDQFLDFKTGDAHVIRNAGGLVTDDAIRSLIISTFLLGTREIFVIEHTDCGMLTFEEKDVQEKLKEKFNADASGTRLYPFKDLKANVKAQIEKIRDCPFIPDDIPVHGMIYHCEDGSLEDVE